MSTADPVSPLKGRNTVLLIILAVVSIAAIIGANILGKWRAFSSRPGPLAEVSSVVIKRGQSVRAIAEQLEAAKIIADADTFRFGARFFSGSAPIKAGEFSVPAGATMAEVMAVLQSANAVQYRLLIREGITVAQALKSVTGYKRLSGVIAGDYPEGSLLPDTYFYVRGEARDAVLQRMRDAMDEELDAAWRARRDADQLKSPEELLVMASIIEKETGRDEEMKMVSGVFHNRLRKGMKLQSDPTVIYGISQGPLGRSLKRKDVRTPTPYNTYTIKGLPPGPIALPSREALIAAGQPAKTDALFFVVDGSGGHVFAATYAEHKANIRKWRQKVRARRYK